VGSYYRRFLQTFRGPDFGDRMVKSLTHQEIMQSFPKTWHLCWHGSAIIRKSLFDTIGLYDEQPYGSDTFWLSKAGLYGYLTGRVLFKNVPLYLTYKREHPESQTGSISPVDPRSRRHKLEAYYLAKLGRIMEKGLSDGTQVAAELGACTCTDFIPLFGDRFEQWESQPVDDVMCRQLLDKAMAQFAGEQYVSCLITLSGLDRMTGGRCRTWANLNFTCGLAAYAAGEDAMASAFLSEEARLSGHAAALALVKRIQAGSVSNEAWLRRKEVRDFITLSAQKRQTSQPQSALSDIEANDCRLSTLAREFSGSEQGAALGRSPVC
jgi:hypothetical protein